MRFVFGHLFQALCGGYKCFSIPPPAFIMAIQSKLRLASYTLADVGSACVQLISCVLRKRVVGLCLEPVEFSQYQTPSFKKPFALFVHTSNSPKFPDQNVMFQLEAAC